MFGILLAIGTVVLIAILLLIYRIYTLVSVVRGTEKKRVSKKSNLVNAVLFILFMLIFGGWFFYYSFAAYDKYQIPLASIHGIEYEQIFWTTTWICVAVFVFTHVLLFVFSFIYRYKKDRVATFYPDNTKLEVVWTIIPAIVLSILVFGGFQVWNDMTGPAPEEAEVLEIMGYQFAWEARYPGEDGKLGGHDFRLIDAINPMGVNFRDENAYDDFIAREIYLPKGVPVEMHIRARDVLHSVYLPHFRQKMDAMPGMPTRLWFTPTKTTAEMREELNDPDFNYELACAEICGRGHFSMRKVVVVVEPEEYAKWYAGQETMTEQYPELRDLPLEDEELGETEGPRPFNEEAAAGEEGELSQK